MGFIPIDTDPSRGLQIHGHIWEIHRLNDSIATTRKLGWWWTMPLNRPGRSTTAVACVRRAVHPVALKLKNGRLLARLFSSQTFTLIRRLRGSATR